MDGVERCIDDEIPFEIPESWGVARLESACRLLNGVKTDDKQYNYLEARYLRKKAEAKTLTTGMFVSKGNLLILVDGENSGEIFIAPEDGYLGSTFKILWIPSCLHSRYVIQFINLHKDLLRNSKKGAAIPHLNKELFFNILIPIPPLAEQQRITRRLDSLFNNIDALRQQ